MSSEEDEPLRNGVNQAICDANAAALAGLCNTKCRRDLFQPPVQDGAPFSVQKFARLGGGHVSLLLQQDRA